MINDNDVFEFAIFIARVTKHVENTGSLSTELMQEYQVKWQRKVEDTIALFNDTSKKLSRLGLLCD